MVATKFIKETCNCNRYRTPFQLTTDGFTGYNYAVGTQSEGRVHYGQLVKVYKHPRAMQSVDRNIAACESHLTVKAQAKRTSGPNA